MSHKTASAALRAAALLAVVATFITICTAELPGVTVTEVAFD
jgi:hypothetical protein